MRDARSSGEPGAETAADAAGSPAAGVGVAELGEQPRPATGVVVGVDGSVSARGAVIWAAAEAARRGDALHLVEVLPPSTGPSEMGAGVPRGRARALLHRARGEAHTVSPTTPVTMATVQGRVGPALVSYAVHAGLLVVGSNGPGGPIPLSVGRVLHEVTTHAECPAVVVPATRAGSPAAASSRPVLVAVDGTTAGELALAFAAETAHRLAVPLVALTTGKGRHRSRRGEEHELSTEEPARYQERYPGLTIESRDVTGRPEEYVLHAGRGAQLIVVSSLRPGAAAGSLVGWTRQLLFYSPCAVAVVSPRTRT